MKKNLFFLFIVLSTFVKAQHTKLVDFADTSNGKWPVDDLIIIDDYLYGTTFLGGSTLNCPTGCGVIFKIKSDGTDFSKIHNFDGANGGAPLGSLIYDGNFLYGMTYGGGASDSGTIFKIKPNGTSFTKLHDFTGIDGALPGSTLIFDGNFFYGMTESGGTNYYGIIFKIKPDGTNYTKLFDFDGALNGGMPWGSLIFDGSFLYGTSYFGGISNNCTNGCGIIFKIKTDGSGFSKIYDFTGNPDGAFPPGSLIYDNFYLYGMTHVGGLYDKGTVFKIKTDGTEYSKLLDLNGYLSGGFPYGTLMNDGTFLYGLTNRGGAFDNGTLFKIRTDGADFFKLHDFIDSSGSRPFGSLIFDGTFLYGTTKYGGTNGIGTIFKFYSSGMMISENKIETGFKVYPNPFSTQTILTINSYPNKVSKKISITIYNSVGQIVAQIDNLNDKQIKIQRGFLQSGLYFIRLIEDHQIFTDKLILADF